MASDKAIEFTITGAEDIRKKLGMLGNYGTEAVRKALYKVANEIMTDSKTNYVPVDTGALRSTGRVNDPEVRGNDVTVVMGYGGPAGGAGGEVGYAVPVHENAYANHPVGSWKYLEIPFNARAKDVLPEVKSQLEKILPSSYW